MGVSIEPCAQLGAKSVGGSLGGKGLTFVAGSVAEPHFCHPTMGRQWQECANSGHSATALRTSQIDAMRSVGSVFPGTNPTRQAAYRSATHHVYLAPNAPRTPFRLSPSAFPTANS